MKIHCDLHPTICMRYVLNIYTVCIPYVFHVYAMCMPCVVNILCVFHVYVMYKPGELHMHATTTPYDVCNEFITYIMYLPYVVHVYVICVR